MLNLNSPKENILNLIGKLERLSQVYACAPIQQNKYFEILTDLRENYKLFQNLFTENMIDKIRNLKQKIEDGPEENILHRANSIKYWPSDKYSPSETIAYYKSNYGFPINTALFHDDLFFIALVVDRNAVQKKYNLLMLDGKTEWWKSTNLLVIGCAEKAWNELHSTGRDRETHCWNCKTPLDSSDKTCKSCGWYICPQCGSCNCQKC
jgi:hypothetical protein